MTTLIKFIENFMFMSEEITEPLECLRVIILKKIVRAEIYDMIDKI